MTSLYLDTSALVKRRVSEPGSDLVFAACAGATCYTARYSAIEAESALCRRHREGFLDVQLRARDLHAVTRRNR
jgi:predicted nucleic acid-binding protein